MGLASIKRALRRSTFRRSALNGLSQPLHIFEYVTRSQHYHFGYFATRDTPLRSAMDHMVERSLSHFGRHARVVDVGCALGGTSCLLGERGLDVVGIDPCPRAIDYARSRSASGAVTFFCGRLDDFPRSSEAPFDGVILIEVLQHFAALEELFRVCRALLRPGGVIVVDDVVDVSLERLPHVPFHRHDDLLRAASAVGFDVIESEDVSPWTAPTLSRLAGELAGRRGEIERFFSRGRPNVDSELDELIDQVHLLRRGFAEGHLAYRSTVLRRGD